MTTNKENNYFALNISDDPAAIVALCTYAQVVLIFNESYAIKLFGLAELKLMELYNKFDSSKNNQPLWYTDEALQEADISVQNLKEIMIDLPSFYDNYNRSI